MRTYIKPSLNVVELSVKESIAALRKKTTESFGFGSGSKSTLSNISRTIATLSNSDVDTTSASWLANYLYI